MVKKKNSLEFAGTRQYHLVKASQILGLVLFFKPNDIEQQIIPVNQIIREGILILYFVLGICMTFLL